MITTETLALDYAFVSSPNPIRASVGGANPNTIAMQVIVSSSSPAAVAMRGITIEIPTGEEVSGDISTARNLPPPTYDTTIPWVITASGATISIEPTAGGSGAVIAPIIFTVPGIQVNETPGTVPITVTEFPPPPAPRIADHTTYTLLKQPADFPVVNFYADPSILTNLDLPVTLYWTCSEQGEQNVFGLRADLASVARTVATEARSAPASPALTDPARAGPTRLTLAGLHDCLDDGVCYSCQDGAHGVTVPGVNQSTDFSLDVVQSDSSGHRTIVATLSTTVRVELPVISPDSYLTQHFTWSQVSLHWLAFNARECSVSVNGSVVDEHAPSDTYAAGYPLALPNEPGMYQVSLTAFAAFGEARTTFLFQDVRVGPVASIPLGSNPTSVAITPDGSLALVTQNLGESPGAVTVVDVQARQAEATTIPTVMYPWSVGITPDGTLALVTAGSDDYVGIITVIDVAKRRAEPTPIELPTGLPNGNRVPLMSRPTVVRVTPDGTLGLVGNFFNATVAVVDIAQRRVEPTLMTLSRPAITLDLAITPDGAHALVLGSPGNQVWVLDIAARAYEPTTIPAGFGPMAIAITPDGTLALVASAQPTTVVTVIDIASRTAEPTTIPVCSSPTSIAITPDGSTAIVTSGDTATLTMIDIASRTAVTGPSPGQLIGPSNPAAAVTVDGQHVLLLNNPASQLVVF